MQGCLGRPYDNKNWTCLALIKHFVPEVRTGERRSPRRWGGLMRLPASPSVQRGDVVVWGLRWNTIARGWTEFTPMHVALVVNPEECFLLDVGHGADGATAVWRWDALHLGFHTVRILRPQLSLI